jgi:hypothetical protein
MIILHEQLLQEDVSTGCWKIYLDRSRCQETAGEDCSRLKTLVCVCQWTVKCSSEWCIQVANKSNIQSIPRLESRSSITWQYALHGASWQRLQCFWPAFARFESRSNHRVSWMKLFSSVSPDESFCSFTNVPYGFFHVISNSSFSNQSIFRPYTTWATDSVVKINYQ